MVYIPEVFGPYRLLRRISVGQLAETFEALRAGQRVIVKRALPTVAEDKTLRASFDAETELAQRLDHPCIGKVAGRGEHFGLPYVEWVHVDGVTAARLRDAIVAGTLSIPWEHAAHIGRAVARGLAYAHALLDEHGRPLELVHRDVSPQNILIGYDGAVVLTDFGCARVARSRRAPTAIGIVKGKLGYLAPEQASGATLDARTDIFQLGVVLHELLAARRAFPYSDLGTLTEALSRGQWPAAPSLPSTLPAGLRAAVSKMLAVDPARRFAQASLVAEAFGALLAEDRLCQQALAAWVSARFAPTLPSPTDPADLAASLASAEQLGEVTTDELQLEGATAAVDTDGKNIHAIVAELAGKTIRTPEVNRDFAAAPPVSSDKQPGRSVARISWFWTSLLVLVMLLGLLRLIWW